MPIHPFDPSEYSLRDLTEHFKQQLKFYIQYFSPGSLHLCKQIVDYLYLQEDNLIVKEYLKSIFKHSLNTLFTPPYLFDFSRLTALKKNQTNLFFSLAPFIEVLMTDNKVLLRDNLTAYLKSFPNDLSIYLSFFIL